MCQFLFIYFFHTAVGDEWRCIWIWRSIVWELWSCKWWIFIFYFVPAALPSLNYKSAIAFLTELDQLLWSSWRSTRASLPFLFVYYFLQKNLSWLRLYVMCILCQIKVSVRKALQLFSVYVLCIFILWNLGIDEIIYSGSEFWLIIICTFVWSIGDWTAVPGFYVLSPNTWFYFTSYTVDKISYSIICYLAFMW
jgi:hypothetical protein